MFRRLLQSLWWGGKLFEEHSSMIRVYCHQSAALWCHFHAARLHATDCNFRLSDFPRIQWAAIYLFLRMVAIHELRSTAARPVAFISVSFANFMRMYNKHFVLLGAIGIRNCTMHCTGSWPIAFWVHSYKIIIIHHGIYLACMTAYVQADKAGRFVLLHLCVIDLLSMRTMFRDISMIHVLMERVRRRTKPTDDVI